MESDSSILEIVVNRVRRGKAGRSGRYNNHRSLFTDTGFFLKSGAAMTRFSLEMVGGRTKKNSDRPNRQGIVSSAGVQKGNPRETPLQSNTNKREEELGFWVATAGSRKDRREGRDYVLLGGGLCLPWTEKSITWAGKPYCMAFEQKESGNRRIASPGKT